MLLDFYKRHVNSFILPLKGIWSLNIFCESYLKILLAHAIENSEFLNNDPPGNAV